MRTSKKNCQQRRNISSETLKGRKMDKKVYPDRWDKKARERDVIHDSVLQREIEKVPTLTETSINWRTKNKGPPVVAIKES